MHNFMDNKHNKWINITHTYKYDEENYYYEFAIIKYIHRLLPSF